ncbi:MAG: ferritin-like domain-containing protein [Thermacetogeniaceae bacterium]
MGSLDQLIKMMNVALSWEYAAMIQYIQHASMLTGPEYFAISGEELRHARDEFEHAVKLSEKIQHLGGVPTVVVAEVKTSWDNAEMLRQDLQGEINALNSYRKLTEMAEELHLYDVGEMLREIALDEQGHAVDLERALGIQKAR